MKAAPVDAEAEFRIKLDRLGHLIFRKAADDAEPWRAELEALKDEIQLRYAAEPGDVPIRATGSVYHIDLTRRENRRTVTDPQKAFDTLKKAMGLPELIKVLKIPFALLDRWVTAERQAAWVTQSRTGSRDLTAVPIEAA